ncbi:MAG: hypothetical protein K940chlam3_01401 [Chlamydiae bacterium]|nr:hypothetical protein [Chlamydiota bacterium]
MFDVSPKWNSYQMLFFPQDIDKSRYCHELSLVLNKDRNLMLNMIMESLTHEVEFNGEKRRLTSYGNKSEMQETAEKINDALTEGHLVIVFAHLQERYENYEVIPNETKLRFKVTFSKSEEPLEVPTDIEEFREFKMRTRGASPFREKNLTKLGSVRFEVMNWREEFPDRKVKLQIAKFLGIPVALDRMGFTGCMW